MKKIVALLAVVILTLSCGKNKEEENKEIKQTIKLESGTYKYRDLSDPSDPPEVKKETAKKETTKSDELPDLDAASSFLDYVEPKTEKEAFEKQVSTSLGTPGRSSVKGSKGLIKQEQ